MKLKKAGKPTNAIGITIDHSALITDDPLTRCIDDYMYVTDYIKSIATYKDGLLISLFNDNKQLVFMSDGSFSEIQVNENKIKKGAKLTPVSREEVIKYGSARDIAMAIDCACGAQNRAIAVRYDKMFEEEKDTRTGGTIVPNKMKLPRKKSGSKS
jgi:hypothetical protein